MCVSSSFCWRANSKEHSLHATLSSWWVGAGGVCRWKEEALHCPGEREAPGGRNSSSPANMGWLWPCWKSWAKSWVSPLPMAPEDRTSGYEWISVLCTNQSIAGLWVCFSLCQKCHLLLSYFIWSTPLPNSVFSGPLLSPSWCLSLLPPACPLPAPSRLRAPWDKHQMSPGSQETFEECMNQSGDATKSLDNRTTGIDEVRILASFQAPSRDPWSQILFIII